MASTRVDARQVEAFEKRLNRAAQNIQQQAESFEQEWGGKWVDEMRATVPVETGKGRDSIAQDEPGEITMEGYLRYPEYGTSRIAPRPFIRPTMKRILPPARKDAGERAINLIRRGR